MRTCGPACIGLTFVLFGAGCDAEPIDAEANPVEDVVASSEPESEDRPESFEEPDGHHREPIPLKLALRGPEGDTVRTLTADDIIELDVSNESDRSGVVEVQVRDTLGTVPTGRSVVEVELDGGGRTTLAIKVGELGLANSKIADLGRLSFHGRLHATSGPGITSAPISIPFSADGDRWTLYGPDASDAEVVALDLPEQARDELRAALAEGPQTIVLPDGTELRAGAPTLTPAVQEHARADALSVE